MNHYVEYRREKDDAEVIHTEEGFIAFQVVGDRCHIGEMYVARDKRRMGAGKRLEARAIGIARSLGANKISGRVAKGERRSGETLIIAFANGYRIEREDETQIIIVKEI